jgi:hypothetical protein
MEIRKTELHDLEEVLEIYKTARQFMQNNGNSNQWIDGYPQKYIIETDIKNGNHYVCYEKEKILGCFALINGEDPTYQIIKNGNWLNEAPYSALHRLASAKQRKGVGKICLNWCVKQHQNIRVDTHKSNLTMQYLLKQTGFEQCGVILNRWGDERIAFQKS